jgi:hypothetical protein
MKILKSRNATGLWCGISGFWGSGSQEVEFHVSATPEITKRKKMKSRVLSINRRIRVTKV